MADFEFFETEIVLYFPYWKYKLLLLPVSQQYFDQ